MSNASYQAASSFPYKMVYSADVMEKLVQGVVLPFHVSLSPTNLCNRRCHFCSCADRKVTDQFSLDSIQELYKVLSYCGTRAITITGGGEPLLHRQINEIIMSCPFEMGLVTNGDALERLELPALNRLTWMRVSCGDDFNNLSLLARVWDRAINGGKPDWALSYVLSSEKINIENLLDHVRFTLSNGFSHIRIVNDIIDASQDGRSALEASNFVLGALRSADLLDERVIIQDRARPCSGVNPCLVSLLRPFIASDGQVYACCGLQYALGDDRRDLPREHSMGHWSELPEIIDSQRYFDGRVCKVCYYGAYNEALRVLTGPIAHGAFI